MSMIINGPFSTAFVLEWGKGCCPTSHVIAVVMFKLCNTHYSCKLKRVPYVLFPLIGGGGGGKGGVEASLHVLLVK